MPEGLWEKIRIPCDERWEAAMTAENLRDESSEDTCVPTMVVARIARRVFPTLRNTDAVTLAFRSVDSDAAGLVKITDLKRLIHNLVFINNHWPALHALKRNSGYEMDLTTFRGSWQSFDKPDAEKDTSIEADTVFTALLNARQDTADEERPTRVSFDEFISALSLRYADGEDKDGGFETDLDDKLKLAAELKIAGNESYKKENWSEAIEHYTRALDAIKACEAESSQVSCLALPVDCHTAVCAYVTTCRARRRSSWLCCSRTVPRRAGSPIAAWTHSQTASAASSWLRPTGEA